MSPTMRILITGGTGLLGNNVLRQALERGHEVVATTRDSGTPPALANLPIQTCHVPLDQLDAQSYQLGKIDAIVHAAAQIQIGWTRREECYRANVVGTRSVCQAAKNLSAHLVHVSSVDTIPTSWKPVVHDESTTQGTMTQSTYVVTKTQAEQEVKQAIANGLHATIVHPGFMLGPYDWKPSSGRMVQAIANSSFLPLAPSGGISLTSVRDVATAILNAIDQSPPEQHYVLAGNNITYFDLWRELARRFQRPAPVMVLRYVPRVVLGAFSDLMAYCTGHESDFNSAALAMGSQFHWYSSDLAIRDLQFQIRSVDEILSDSIAWLISNNQIQRTAIP